MYELVIRLRCHQVVDITLSVSSRRRSRVYWPHLCMEVPHLRLPVVCRRVMYDVIHVWRELAVNTGIGFVDVFISFSLIATSPFAVVCNGVTRGFDLKSRCCFARLHRYFERLLALNAVAALGGRFNGIYRCRRLTLCSLSVKLGSCRFPLFACLVRVRLTCSTCN